MVRLRFAKLEVVQALCGGSTPLYHRTMLRSLLVGSLVLGISFAGACSDDASESSPGAGGNTSAGPGGDGDPTTHMDSGSEQSSDAATCTAGTKACDDQCVSETDPEVGCAAAGCLPCFFANASAICDESGACALGECNEGYADCDANAQNGCEAHPSDDRHNRHACGNVCEFEHADGDCLPDTGCTLLICDPGWGNCTVRDSSGDASTPSSGDASTPSSGDASTPPSGDASALSTGEDCETDITTLTDCGECAVACSGTDICLHDDILGGYQCAPPP